MISNLSIPILILACCFFSCDTGTSTSPSEESIPTVQMSMSTTVGEILSTADGLKIKDGENWLTVLTGDPIKEGDVYKCFADDEAEISLYEDAQIEFSPSTDVDFISFNDAEYQDEEGTWHSVTQYGNISGVSAIKTGSDGAVQATAKTSSFDNWVLPNIQ